jgi:hypothetical protein
VKSELNPREGDVAPVRAGDRVLVECEAFIWNRPRNWPHRDRETFDLNEQYEGLLFRALRVHSIEPRPIAVGDRVKCLIAERGAWDFVDAEGEVIAIHKDMAWVQFTVDPDPRNIRLSALARMEESDAD